MSARIQISDNFRKFFGVCSREFTSTQYSSDALAPLQDCNPVSCQAAPVSPAVDTEYKFVMEHPFVLCIFVKYIKIPRNAVWFNVYNFTAYTQIALIVLLIYYYFVRIINTRNKEQIYMMCSQHFCPAFLFCICSYIYRLYGESTSDLCTGVVKRKLCA